MVKKIILNITQDIIASAESGYQDAKIAFDTDTPAVAEDNSNMIAIINRHNNSPLFLSAYNKAYRAQLEVMYKDFLFHRLAGKSV